MRFSGLYSILMYIHDGERWCSLHSVLISKNVKTSLNTSCLLMELDVSVGIYINLPVERERGLSYQDGSSKPR